MKILQLVKTSDAAGWALEQMRDLVNQGYEVHVALPLGGKHIQSYLDYNITIHEINYDLKRPIRTIRCLRKIVKEISPDIIHSHFYITTLFMRIGLRNCPIPRVFMLPGPSHLYYAITRKIELLLHQDNDYWIGACKYSCQCYLNEGIDKSHVFLSYYQGDPLTDNDIHKDEHKLRAEFDLPPEAILVGMISYMYPPKYYLGQTRGIKGHEDFIDAIAISSKINKNIYGICVGGAWQDHFSYEKRIKQYAQKRTDHIVFCGSRTNVPEIYPEFCCAVQPSHQENLGGAAQAYRYGCPIIATDVGGLPDIVHDGVTGYLVPKKDPQKLAEAILKMVDNPQKAKEMMLEGRRQYIQLKENNRDSLDNIYKTIIAAK